MTKKITHSKEKKKSAVVSAHSPSGNKQSLKPSTLASLIIILLYVLTELVPQLGAIDSMGTQWLYLSVLNCFVSLYLLLTKKLLPDQFFRTTLFLLYSGLIIICGLSFFASYNIVESVVTYSRLIVSFIAFLNILSIIYNDSKILKPLFLMMGLLVLYQSLDVIVEFLRNYKSAPNLDELILSIKGNTGNKNILAASIVIKIPFLIYAVYTVRFFGQIFYLIIFFLSCIVLFILNARAAFVSLFIEAIIYLAFVIVFYFKNGKGPVIFRKPALLTIVLITSIFTAQLIFTSIEKQKSHYKYGSITERVETIGFSKKQSSKRTIYWSNAVDFIQKHWLLGGGYGNWKIHTIPYENHRVKEFQTSKHVHNDFLEVTADTGILGGLIYSGIFFFIFYYAFQFLKLKDALLEHTMIIGTSLIAFTAYSVDSFVNFPLERPNIQVLMTLLSGIICFGYLNMKRAKSNGNIYYIHKNINALCILFSLVTMYLNFQVYQSMKLQNKIWGDWTGEKWKFKAAEINPYFPLLPNITESEIPIACVKASYLIKDHKEVEALAVLNADKRSNPYLYYAEYLRSMIAENLNRHDSAYYYAKLAYYNRPLNFLLLENLNKMAARRKDSVEIMKSYREFTLWRTTLPQAWSNCAQNIFDCTGNAEAALQITRDGLKIFPGDTTLLFDSKILEGRALFDKKMFTESINFYKSALGYKDDIAAKQNIPLAYMNMGDYKNAVPYLSGLINEKLLNNGKSEYLRGVCYQHLNEKDSACFDFLNARSLGFRVEPALTQECR